MLTCFQGNGAIVQSNNSSFIRQTPLIMLIVCVCPHSFNVKDIRRAGENVFSICHFCRKISDYCGYMYQICSIKRRRFSVSLDLVLKWIHGSLIFLWDSPNLIQKFSRDFHSTEFSKYIKIVVLEPKLWQYLNAFAATKIDIKSH